MIEIVDKDIWTYPAEVYVITTNGSINRSGNAVMGRGIALQAKSRFPGIAKHLGELLLEEGNHVYSLGWYKDRKDGKRRFLYSFPVKDEWHETANLGLILRSACELKANHVDYWGYEKVAMPRPGCGNGGLKWTDVKKVIQPVLNDRFVVVERNKS